MKTPEWYLHLPPLPRPRLKQEVKTWWCGLIRRHKPEGRMVIGVRVLDYSIMEGGYLSVRNEITDEVAFCQRCKKTLRVTVKNGRPVYE